MAPPQRGDPQLVDVQLLVTSGRSNRKLWFQGFPAGPAGPYQCREEFPAIVRYRVNIAFGPSSGDAVGGTVIPVDPPAVPVVGRGVGAGGIRLVLAASART